MPRLGLTAHVGEDFVYLTSGMRRIAEALDHFGFAEGDRIGHGMALGLDPAIWARETGPILMAREDRLLDLVWERACLLRDDMAAPGNRLSLVEHLLREQVSRVFRRLYELDVIDRFVAFLHDGQQLEWIGFPDDFNRRPPQAQSDAPVDAQALACLAEYLTDADLFHRGRELIQVDPVPEVEAMRALQFGLRARLGRLGIPVEVNPSSNLLIGNLVRMEHHPIFRLNPVPHAAADNDAGRSAGPPQPPTVSVCVGSDDPLVFACDLPRELALLHDTLIDADIPSEAVVRWLREVMRTGRQARFTCAPVTAIDPSPLIDPARILAPIP